MVEILLKTPNFLVVNKDHDLIINSSDSNRESLDRKLQRLFPVEVNTTTRFGFYYPHRLDFSTSGVMCIALSKEACAAASSAFQDRKSTKYYLALLRGHLSHDSLQVDVPVGQASSELNETPNKMKANGRKCRTAISRILVLERGLYSDYPATKVLLTAVTGRRHQLRVHCHFLGHTVIGDYTYSNRKDITPPRMFLHAYRLVLPNKLGDIDVRTDDPFSESLVKNWTPVNKSYELDDQTMESMKSESSCIIR